MLYIAPITDKSISSPSDMPKASFVTRIREYGFSDPIPESGIGGELLDGILIVIDFHAFSSSSIFSKSLPRLRRIFTADTLIRSICEISSTEYPSK